MINNELIQRLTLNLASLKNVGLYKHEYVLSSPQKAIVQLEDGNELINLCANNYLGLADDPTLINAAQEALISYGYGLSSVRFICGTQTIHKQLEEKIAQFLGMEDSILYSSCFDANGGLFETLLEAEDAVISDSLNHASIIDGVRLCKAKRFRYQNNDMQHLEEVLKEASSCRVKLIVTDGVFSMDGIIANLPTICDLAERYEALVMVDDSHAVGFMGKNGKGSHEFHNVMGRVDILSGTLGKALGGASGGYISSCKEIVSWLRQRSRPYLFSNTLAPVIAATSIKVLEILESNLSLLEKLKKNSIYFRTHMQKLGFDLIPGEHPIIPIMLGDAKLASQMAAEMFKNGIYVIPFSYPVVPQNQARLRTQMSAGHEHKHLELAITAFEKAGKKLGII